MATILCAAHPNEGKGKHLEYWEEGGVLLDPVAQHLTRWEVMSIANRLFRGCWREKDGMDSIIGPIRRNRRKRVEKQESLKLSRRSAQRGAKMHSAIPCYCPGKSRE
jgi:hypothetical protein